MLIMSTGSASPSKRTVLSSKQITTLRLVQCNLSSKEIARLQGVTSYAIDAQIERAMQRLEVSSRNAAARWVMNHVPGPYERFVYEAQPLAALGHLPSIHGLPDRQDHMIEDGVAEAPASYVAPVEILSDPFRSLGMETRHALKPATLLWLIPVIAFVTLCVLVTLLVVGERASVWAYKHLPSYRSTTP